MSTFFGIFQTDLSPVGDELFHRMEAAMNNWSADKVGRFTDPGIALGNLLLYMSPQSIHEQLPFSSGPFTIAGDIRLDNREEIVQKLGGDQWADPELPDSALLLELYRRKGKDAVRDLIGDFAFCIWNAQDHTLFCARDHLGVRPFYYYNRNNLFIFASEKRGILSVPGVDASVNEEYGLLLLADLDTPSDQTFFKHIRQLPAANTLAVDRSGVQLETYWKLEMPSLLRLKDPEDYYEGFRALFKTAVKARVNTTFPIGVELSGGLDSTGILGFAKGLINDPKQLHTFSNVAPVDNEGRKKAVDEEEWIDLVVRYNGVSNVHKVRTGGWQDTFEPHDLELKIHASPMPYGSSWMEPVRREMEKAGIRIALSGFGGDEFITNQSENYFYDIFYEKDYAAFFKVCMQQKIPLMPAKMFLRSLLPVLGLNAFPRDLKKPVERCSVLLNKNLEERLRIGHDSSARQTTPDRSHKRMIIDIISRPWLGYRLEAEAGFATSHRLVNCYPLLDIRLLSFFLSVPARMIGHPGLSRAFYRTAMTGFIPDEVRLRKDKSVAASPFSALEVGARMDDCLSWIREINGNPKTGLLSELDFDELAKRFDPGNKENFIGGMLRPRVNFHTLSMLRYFQKNSR